MTYLAPQHRNPVPARSTWTNTELEQHQSEMLTERAALIEMNDPHTHLPRIEASLKRTEDEMLIRLMKNLQR